LADGECVAVQLLMSENANLPLDPKKKKKKKKKERFD